MNKPLSKDQVKSLKKGNYAHKHPNRRTRRSGMVSRNKDVVSGGDDTGKVRPEAGRNATGLGEQAPVEVPPLYGFRSRYHLMAYVLVRRLRATFLAFFHRLSVWR